MRKRPTNPSSSRAIDGAVIAPGFARRCRASAFTARRPCRIGRRCARRRGFTLMASARRTAIGASNPRRPIRPAARPAERVRRPPQRALATDDVADVVGVCTARSQASTAIRHCTRSAKCSRNFARVSLPVSHGRGQIRIAASMHTVDMLYLFTRYVMPVGATDIASSRRCPIQSGRSAKPTAPGARPPPRPERIQTRGRSDCRGCGGWGRGRDSGRGARGRKRSEGAAQAWFPVHDGATIDAWQPRLNFETIRESTCCFSE